jgi:hypothetical protein
MYRNETAPFQIPFLPACLLETHIHTRARISRFRRKPTHPPHSLSAALEPGFRVAALMPHDSGNVVALHLAQSSTKDLNLLQVGQDVVVG